MFSFHFISICHAPSGDRRLWSSTASYICGTCSCIHFHKHVKEILFPFISIRHVHSENNRSRSSIASPCICGTYSSIPSPKRVKKCLFHFLSLCHVHSGIRRSRSSTASCICGNGSGSHLVKLIKSVISFSNLLLLSVINAILRELLNLLCIFYNLLLTALFFFALFNCILFSVGPSKKQMSLKLQDS